MTSLIDDLSRKRDQIASTPRRQCLLHPGPRGDSGILGKVCWSDVTVWNVLANEFYSRVVNIMKLTSEILGEWVKWYVATSEQNSKKSFAWCRVLKCYVFMFTSVWQLGKLKYIWYCFVLFICLRGTVKCSSLMELILLFSRYFKHVWISFLAVIVFSWLYEKNSKRFLGVSRAEYQCL